jgi:hypothetical protein
MGNVKTDCAQLKKYRDNLARLNGPQKARFTEAAVKELAARLLAKAKKRTPVGAYPAGSGKAGGTLRRGWTVGNVRRTGGGYSIDVINPVEYASYVEFGHRTRGGKGWAPGKSMLTISEQELQRDAPGILSRKLERFVRDTLNAK